MSNLITGHRCERVLGNSYQRDASIEIAFEYFFQLIVVRMKHNCARLVQHALAGQQDLSRPKLILAHDNCLVEANVFPNVAPDGRANVREEDVLDSQLSISRTNAHFTMIGISAAQEHAFDPVGPGARQLSSEGAGKAFLDNRSGQPIEELRCCRGRVLHQIDDDWPRGHPRSQVAGFTMTELGRWNLM